MKKEGTKLGSGAYGSVYPASHSGKKYAIKRNYADHKLDGIGPYREADSLSTFRHHPLFIYTEYIFLHPPFDSAMSPIPPKNKQKDDIMHFAFEMAKHDLFHEIHQASIVDYSDHAYFIAQLFLGLEYMHARGRIHRDVKPSNLLIVANTVVNPKYGKPVPARILKISDFGMSKVHTYQGNDTPRASTSWYRAPEVIIGACAGPQKYGFKSDIWSAMLTVFEMFSRKPLLYSCADDPSVLMNALVRGLPDIISTYEYNKLEKRGTAGVKVVINTTDMNRYTSFREKIGLNMKDQHIKSFEACTGCSFDLLIDLITRGVSFDEDKRPTATEVLKHSFFDPIRWYIDEMRKLHPPKPEADTYLRIHKCPERKWAMDIAQRVFQKRGSITFYSDRLLFQGIDLFDRYLESIFLNKEEMDKKATEAAALAASLSALSASTTSSTDGDKGKATTTSPSSSGEATGIQTPTEKKSSPSPILPSPTPSLPVISAETSVRSLIRPVESAGQRTLGGASSPGVSAEEKGTILNRDTAESNFVFCLYISLKYFPHNLLSYSFAEFIKATGLEDVSSGKMGSVSMVLNSNAFERKFASEILHYKIYRETAYEAADKYSVILNQSMVSSLLSFISQYSSSSPVSGKDIFDAFTKANLSSYDQMKKIPPHVPVSVGSAARTDTKTSPSKTAQPPLWHPQPPRQYAGPTIYPPKAAQPVISYSQTQYQPRTVSYPQQTQMSYMPFSQPVAYTTSYPSFAPTPYQSYNVPLRLPHVATGVVPAGRYGG